MKVLKKGERFWERITDLGSLEEGDQLVRQDGNNFYRLNINFPSDKRQQWVTKEAYNKEMLKRKINEVLK